jgi:hypothetical protein
MHLSSSDYMQLFSLSPLPPPQNDRIVINASKNHIILMIFFCGSEIYLSRVRICEIPCRYEASRAALQCMYLQVYNQIILPQFCWGTTGVWHHKPLKFWAYTIVDDGGSSSHWATPACVCTSGLQVGPSIVKWTAWSHEGGGPTICRT